MHKAVKITIRVTPEFKALLEHNAKEEHRSVTAYLEWLVLQEAKRKVRRKTDANDE